MAADDDADYVGALAVDYTDSTRVAASLEMHIYYSCDRIVRMRMCSTMVMPSFVVEARSMPGLTMRTRPLFSAVVSRAVVSMCCLCLSCCCCCCGGGLDLTRAFRLFSIFELPFHLGFESFILKCLYLYPLF